MGTSGLVLCGRISGRAVARGRRGARYTHPLTRTELAVLYDDDEGPAAGVGEADAAALCGGDAERVDQRLVRSGCWQGELAPGDVALVAVEAGGSVKVAGAGERAEVVATRAAWVHIVVPRSAAQRAAAADATASMAFDIRGVVGEPWRRDAAPAVRAAPRQWAEEPRGGADVAMGAAVPLPPVPAAPDLAAWVRQWVARQAEAGGAAERPDSPLWLAAGATLADAIGSCPGLLRARLADWLRDHITGGLNRGARQWQWTLLVQCWVLHEAGLPAMFRADPDTADELLRQARINPQAARQQPFVGWRAGRDSFGPACRIPGQHATGRTAVQVGRLPWSLGRAACEALEAAVVHVRAGEARGSGGAGMDLDAGARERGTGAASDAGALGRPGATGGGDETADHGADRAGSGGAEQSGAHGAGAAPGMARRAAGVDDPRDLPAARPGAPAGGLGGGATAAPTAGAARGRIDPQGPARMSSVCRATSGHGWRKGTACEGGRGAARGRQGQAATLEERRTRASSARRRGSTGHPPRPGSSGGGSHWRRWR